LWQFGQPRRALQGDQNSAMARGWAENFEPGR
jgi:hypothetical protein